jgi:replicative DNA helicase
MRVTDDQSAAPQPAATFDIGAEQIVLGAMLMSTNAIEDVTDRLDADDFYRTTHATIYRAIVSRYANGEPTDVVAIVAHLLTTSDLVRIGGAPYLHELMAAVATVGSASWYARTVADCAGRLRLSNAAAAVAQAATSPALTLSEAQDRAGQAVHEAITSNSDTGPSRAGDLLADAFDRIEQAGKRKGLRGITTGFADLDRLTGGLQPGRLYVVAGRPGMGKTVVGLDFVRVNAIRNGVPSMFVTLEMGKDEVMDRILSAQTSIPHHFIQDGDVNDANWTQLARAGAEVDAAPLYIDDSNVNLVQLRTRARRIKQRHGLGLLVVDYLQLMTSSKKPENRQQEVSELSRGLKLLAKELEVPLVAVSQLNRAADARTDKRPSLADLRESGSIEQDADAVILLYREDYYDRESPRSGEADFIIAKHRHGATDTITVASQLHCMRFTDMAIV